jgi:hypothetical protein
VSNEPYKSAEAKTLIRSILVTGNVVLLAHARKEAAKDGIVMGTILNTLRSGIVEPAEWENGAWRYRVRAAQIYVVIQFDGETILIVITTWKARR